MNSDSKPYLLLCIFLVACCSAGRRSGLGMGWTWAAEASDGVSSGSRGLKRAERERGGNDVLITWTRYKAQTLGLWWTCHPRSNYLLWSWQSSWTQSSERETGRCGWTSCWRILRERLASSTDKEDKAHLSFWMITLTKKVRVHWKKPPDLAFAWNDWCTDSSTASSLMEKS